MNKSELIDAVAASADLPKASAGRAIDAMIDTITASLQKDDPVVLVGFGTFGTEAQTNSFPRFSHRGVMCRGSTSRIRRKAFQLESLILAQNERWRQA